MREYLILDRYEIVAKLCNSYYMYSYIMNNILHYFRNAKSYITIREITSNKVSYVLRYQQEHIIRASNKQIRVNCNIPLCNKTFNFK